MNKALKFGIISGVFFIAIMFLVQAARLPQTDGDEDNWGAILNDFLMQQHTASGGHKDLTVEGKVGIGTTTPTAKLNIGGSISVSDEIILINDSSAVNGYIKIKDGTSLSGYMSPMILAKGIGASAAGSRQGFRIIAEPGGDTVDDIAVSVDGRLDGVALSNAALFTVDNLNAEKFRITAFGNVGIGTTSPNLYNHPAGYTTLTIDTDIDERHSVIELVGKNRAVVGAGGIGSIIWFHNDGGTYRRMARIDARIDGATDASYLQFKTKETGLSADAPTTERMRITSDGEVKIAAIGGDGTGKVVCIKSDQTLGTCSDAPGGDGTCTCS